MRILLRRTLAALTLAMLSVAGLAFTAAPAAAEVVKVSPASLEIRAVVDTAANPDQLWDRMLDVRQWWDPAHSYSGDTRNMLIAPRTGGCWCERWNAGEVEHGRVILVMPGRTLRMSIPFGLLRERGVTGILTILFEPLDARGNIIPVGPNERVRHNGRTRVTLTYRVAGDAEAELDKVAPAIDEILTAATTRLALGR